MRNMILEHAVLEVRPGQEQGLELAFRSATAIISSMSDFNTLRLERCLERPSRYLLLVEWTHLEDHTEGFRGSPEYEVWKRLLHHYYDPFPSVEHFEPVTRVERAPEAI